MKLEIYAIWDDKAKAYMQPFFMLNDQLAIRTFANAANAENNQLHVNSEDYTLFAVGSFDDATGTFVIKAPELLVSALQVRRPV